ncbi:hypothetical protein N7539_008602 [Penicillium diatomitis]|uniref:Uncharacterized protein n=1 Tax=Penicillium diatomitis TaxID=2819901 RepID=A0A9W9WR01_9EURO|nr:uncharacterized protein N7539_008602 [Penicillium diatomitis]KAJ5472033.1 hypothetical protein N7539_008602 [Penicillium diatomitis]
MSLESWGDISQYALIPGYTQTPGYASTPANLRWSPASPSNIGSINVDPISPIYYTSPKQTASQKNNLPLLQFGDWEERRIYNEDPPTYTEQDLVLAPRFHWRLFLQPKLKELFTRKYLYRKLESDNISVVVSATRQKGLTLSDAYVIGEFFPTADHGSILLTSRLQRLTKLGKSFQLNILDSKETTQLLLQSAYLPARDAVGQLESNTGTKFLNPQMRSSPGRLCVKLEPVLLSTCSITMNLGPVFSCNRILNASTNRTWMISYHEIQKRDPHAAKLLLLSAHFDNRDIWYELIKSSCHSSDAPVWLERTRSSGLPFNTGVKNLIGFSLRETKEQVGSYTRHPVVQDWCIHLSSTEKNADSTLLNELALIAVGYNVPSSSDRNYSVLQQWLIPHANHVHHGDWSSGNIGIAVWKVFNDLEYLYFDKGKLKEAEEMYQRALAGYEKALGPDHTSTFDTVNNLGNLYKDQGKLKEAEEIHQRARADSEKAAYVHVKRARGAVERLTRRVKHRR